MCSLGRWIRSPVPQMLSASLRSVSTSTLMRPASVPLEFLKFDAKASGDRIYPPVVVLHGLMASSGTYRSLLKRKEFAPRRDVYALDLRNHGASPHDDDTDYSSMAADVTAFMDGAAHLSNGEYKWIEIKESKHMQTDRHVCSALKEVATSIHEDNAFVDGLFRVLGSGGPLSEYQYTLLSGLPPREKVAMIMALECPERVSEVVVVDIAPQHYQAPPEETRPTIVALRAMVKTDLTTLRTREEINEALRIHGVTSLPLRNFLLTNLVPDRDRRGYYRWRVNLRGIVDGLPNLLSFPEYDDSQKYYGRSLFIRGDLSENVTPAHGQQIRKLFPQARIESVDNAGHWVQADAPEAFCRIINQFLHDS